MRINNIRKHILRKLIVTRIEKLGSCPHGQVCALYNRNHLQGEQVIFILFFFSLVYIPQHLFKLLKSSKYLYFNNSSKDLQRLLFILT